MTLKDTHKDWILILLIVGLFGGVIYVAFPYLSAIISGALIAYLVSPIYKRLFQVTKSQRVAGILLSIISIVVFSALIAVVVSSVSTQASTLYSTVKTSFDCSESCAVLDQIELDEDTRQQLLSSIQQLPDIVIPYASNLVDNVLKFVLFLGIALFATAYFLINGGPIRKRITEVLPLRATHKKQIIERFDATIHAVINGNIGIALLQGVVGGIIFFFAGVPAPILLGLLLVLASFIPAIGPLAIWLPAAVILFVQGNVMGAVIVVVLCGTILSYIDNFLKPKVIGDRIKLPQFVVFIAVIGGIGAFGILGLFIGPLLFALLTTCLDIYQKHIH